MADKEMKQLTKNGESFYPYVSADGIVEGTKTINGQSIYGEGDIDIGGGVLPPN